MSYRAPTADILKGIAVLLMIQVHIMELFASQDIYTSNLGKFSLFLGGPPVAPVFMILFGYYMLSSNKAVWQLMLRGASIFILGMLLNLLLNGNLLWSVYRGIIQVNIWPYIFGADILPFAGLTLIVLTPLRSFIRQHIVVVFSMIVLSIFAGNYLMDYLPDNIVLRYMSAFLYGSTDWSYFPLFPWMAYPLLGIAIYQLQQKHDFRFFYLPKTRLLFGVVFLLFFIFTIQYAVSVSSNLSSYYHHGALFFIWVIIFYIFYSLLIHEVYRRIRNTVIIKYIMWLGQHVTIIYVIQWILIGNIATGIYKTVSNPLYLTYWIVGIIVGASTLTYVILQLRNKLLLPEQKLT